MRKKTLVTLLLMIISLVPMVVACGGQAQPSSPEPVTFSINMEEYKYEPDTIQVKVGQEVTLKLVNNGTLAHELMIGRDVAMTTDGRPNGYSVDLFESTNVEPMIMAETMEMEGDAMEDETMDHGAMEDEHQHMGTMVTVKNTGEEASITFVVTEDMVGEWEMGCFELNGVHYDAGMKGTLMVTE